MIIDQVRSARAQMLLSELRSFPHVLAELLALKYDAYTLLLSSKPYDVERVSRGKKPPASSAVERIVVNFLASTYICNLDAFKCACDMLLADSDAADKAVLLSLWRGEVVESFPDHLIWRYAYFRDNEGLPDYFLDDRERERD